MKKLPLYIFYFVSTLEILFLTFEWPEAQLIAKPLIVLSLLWYYFINAQSRSNIFIAALIFCWAGDVFLLFGNRNELFFIFGLVSFLIGHTFFILTYRQQRFEKATHELLGTQKARLLFPIILAGTGLVAILYPALGDLKMPVIVYAAVLTVMVICALLRYGRTTKASFAFVLSGALLFMLSDSLLAINKFLSPLSMAGVSIILTYILAQYLIVAGVLAHTNIQTK